MRDAIAYFLPAPRFLQSFVNWTERGFREKGDAGVVMRTGTAMGISGRRYSMSDVCPYWEKCPIFSGILKDRVFTTKSYLSLYCEAGEEGRGNCKRFQCRERFGRVPENLLPNSNKSIEEIGLENHW
jgi:hypothetical protein